VFALRLAVVSILSSNQPPSGRWTASIAGEHWGILLRMSDRAEPFLAERLWVHPSLLAATVGDPVTAFDDAGRPAVTRYADGGEERYGYDNAGRLIEIDEYSRLWDTVDGDFVCVYRDDCGGRLHVEHDAAGPVRITGPHGTVWERCDEPWPELLRRGAVSLAERCHAAVADADAGRPEVYCLMLIYVGDGGLNVLVNAGSEEDRHFYLARDESPEELAVSLLYPESDGLSFLEVEPDPALDPLLFREAALNDPREPQRTVLTEVAKLLARRDWDPLLQLTDDFIVYIAEHDEGVAEKQASVREVNPADRVARWDAAWRPSLPRD
jgi:YD repeat-containing protein